MILPGPFRAILLGGVIVALPLVASGCASDIESHTSVQDCNGNRYIAPSYAVKGNGGDDGRGSCVLRNGVMPQPQEFD